MIETGKFEKLEVKSTSELRKWLETNHSQLESVWLVTFKKSSLEFYISTSEVLDELLSFGWIDGIRRKLDNERTMQLISPRKTQHWTKTYKERANRLIEEDKMEKAGFDSIKKSKENGLWNFMDEVDNLIIPPDLARYLASYPNATQNFNSFGAASKRNMLRRIKLAKTPETRIKRIKETAVLAAKNEKVHGT